MSARRNELLDRRARRDRARALFDERLGRLRAELAAPKLGSRVVDAITDEAKGYADEAVAIANANKGLMAGMAGALAMWFLRRPLMEGLESLIRRDDNNEQSGSAGKEQDDA